MKDDQRNQKSREELYEAVMDASNTGIVILDGKTMEMIYANPQAVRFSLSEEKNYTGKKCYEYMACERERCQGCVIDQVRTSGFAKSCRIIRSTGKTYSTELKKIDWYGQEVISSCITDVTDVVKGQRELQQSGQLLRQAIEDANLLCWEYDFLLDKLTDENRILREAGYVKHSEQLPETQIADGYVAAESVELYRSMYAEMRRGVSTVAGEIWFYRNRDMNDKHCISISYTVNKNRDGVPVSASGLGLDITDRKNLELLHQKQIETLMRSYPSTLGSLLMNLTKDYVTSQKRLYSFIQERTDQSISRYLEGMRGQIPPEDYERYVHTFSRENLIQMYQNGEQQLSMVHRFQFTDRMRWIKTSVRILPNPLTHELEAYVFAVDVTEKIRTDQMMNQLISKRYDILALIYPKDGFVEFRYAGNEFEDLPEMSIAEYERNRHQSAFLFGEEYAADYVRNTEMDRILEQLDATGQYSFTMSRMIDGCKRYKRYSYNYLSDAREIILSTVQDITALYEKEEMQMKAIQAALLEAEQANAAKTAFLSNMSHDIRTPMNAIINMTKMAQEDIHTPEKAMEDLHKVETSSNFLLSLINDVLDMARIDSGKLEFHPVVYGYEEFLNYIDSVFEPLCRDKDITFIRKKGNTAFPLYIDPLRFNQMFFNLLSNAVKYTDPGGTVIYDERTEAVRDGHLICNFLVSDTGRGMSPEFQKKMFQPFEREESRVGTQTGTGLGLAIVKSTVDQLGGTIHVESHVGKGTTFTIHLTLPLATKEQIADRDKVSKKVNHVSLQGKRILVAEDHPVNRDIMRRLLERRGMLTEMAENGQVCMEAVASHPAGYYDGILMDVRMPVMDGLTATRNIRALEHADAQTIPIIAMTANAFAEDRTLASQAGMTAYLAKPVDAEELYLTLAELLS